MPHSRIRYRFVMAGGVLIFLCLIVYGIFGTVYSSAIENYTTKYNLNAKKELQLVHVVLRHGARTPADTYPLDPYVNETFSPYGWGHLTNEGKDDLFKTGKWLRQRYEHFLGSTYKPDIVHAQATGIARTHMSLSVILAGLWPPKNTPMEWSRSLDWQPIPIFSESLDSDTLLLVRTPCPRYYEAVNEVFQDPKVQKVIQEYQPIFKELTHITGMNISSPDDVQSLYSTLKAEKDFGLELPAWTKSYYPEQLEYLTELSYIYNVYTDELKRIKGGPFVSQIISEWTRKQENTLNPLDRKIFLYTGHDSTVVNILSALNVWELQMPVYGTMAIFELYKDLNTNEFGIEIYLKNNTLSEPYQLIIPGCTAFCPLKTVLHLTDAVLPTDKVAACKAINPNFSEPPLAGP